MIRTIMVPLDGSPAAERALPWAMLLAKRAGAAVRLARVAVPPIPVITEGMGTMMPAPGLYEALHSQEKNYLARTVATTTERYPGVAVTSDLLDMDDSTAGVLAAHAAKENIDLTVMTTLGLKPFSRAMLGSVADEFLRYSTSPTLLLRADPNVQPPLDGPAIRGILVPLDGSKWSEKTLPAALALADLFQVEVELLLVLDAVPDILALTDRTSEGLAERMEPHSALSAANEYLTRTADRLSHHGRTVRTRVVEHGSAAETILAEAESSPDDLIALATHGRGGLSRMIFGSTSDKVIRGAPGPVLVVRPRETA